MTEDVESIAKAARDVHHAFSKLVDPHRAALWRYCRSLAGSQWDGEDLFQETMAKAFASVAQLWQPVPTKSYLFRIATNAWIDELRKRRVQIDSYESIEELPQKEPAVDADDIREALAAAVGLLPPRQTAALLLMDVFGFSAPEAAGMLRTTPGAVYAALHRARRRLSQFNQNQAEQPSRPAESEPPEVPPLSQSQMELVDRLAQAIRTGDADAMLALTSDQIHTDAWPGFQEFSKDQTRKGSGRYVPADRQVEFRVLWGRLVQIVLVRTDHGPQLHDISRLEWEDGRIVYHKSYYFCKELLLAAGEELGVPVQLQKPPGLDWRDAEEESA